MADRTVLLVEDDEDSRRICVAILRHSGYRILEALTAEHGLELARRDVPDLIVMDVGLPGIDGIQATSLLKSDATTASIPIVLLTSRALESDRIRGASAGCDSYLTKPCSPRRVLREVQKFVP